MFIAKTELLDETNNRDGLWGIEMGQVFRCLHRSVQRKPARIDEIFHLEWGFGRWVLACSGGEAEETEDEVMGEREEGALESGKR